MLVEAEPKPPASASSSVKDARDTTHQSSNVLEPVVNLNTTAFQNEGGEQNDNAISLSGGCNEQAMMQLMRQVMTSMFLSERRAKFIDHTERSRYGSASEPRFSLESMGLSSPMFATSIDTHQLRMNREPVRTPLISKSASSFYDVGCAQPTLDDHTPTTFDKVYEFLQFALVIDRKELEIMLITDEFERFKAQASSSGKEYPDDVEAMVAYIMQMTPLTTTNEMIDVDMSYTIKLFSSQFSFSELRANGSDLMELLMQLREDRTVGKYGCTCMIVYDPLVKTLLVFHTAAMLCEPGQVVQRHAYLSAVVCVLKAMAGPSRSFTREQQYSITGQSFLRVTQSHQAFKKLIVERGNIEPVSKSH